MNKQKTLIIDNFDSFTYNLFQYCAELGGNPVVKRNNEISIEEILKDKYTHIIISPGPGTPENPEDFGICGDVILKLQGKLPILGVCLGHQGIIHFLGGNIVRAPYPMHGKQSTITLDTSSSIFKDLPNQIEVMRYHSLIGQKETLPINLKITAQTQDGIIMAVEHYSEPLYGIQFHPESIGTPQGKQILKNFLSISLPNSSKKTQAQKKTLNQFFSDCLEDKYSDIQIAEVLKELSEKGETIEQITETVNFFKERMVKIPLDGSQILDNCGTGGSGIPRMNISTTASFVLAAAGVKVAKHGNRAISGASGSFDLLEKLGIKINQSKDQIVKFFNQTNLAFIYAPDFHPDIKKILNARKIAGGRTIFNLIGPLLNPVSPAYHLLGTTNLAAAEKLIQVMKNLHYKKALVMVGHNGLDDITVDGITHCFELSEGKITTYDFQPDFLKSDNDSQKTANNFHESVGTIEDNAINFHKLLEGKASADLQNMLYLNCAFAFKLYGLCAGKSSSKKPESTIIAGFQKAKSVVESGAAIKKFEEYKQFSNSL